MLGSFVDRRTDNGKNRPPDGHACLQFLSPTRSATGKAAPWSHGSFAEQTPFCCSRCSYRVAGITRGGQLSTAGALCGKCTCTRKATKDWPARRQQGPERFECVLGQDARGNYQLEREHDGCDGCHGCDGGPGPQLRSTTMEPG